MNIRVSTYVSGESAVHACDARVKLTLLVAYTVTIFVVRTWLGMALCVAGFFAAALASRIPLARFFTFIWPVYVLAAFTVVFNSFALDVGDVVYTGGSLGLGAVSSGALGAWEPVALAGTFGFVPAGFARGCFYAVRIVFLVTASLVLTFTTTSTELTGAFSWFLRPLRRVGVPVDDISTVLSLALRFIPVTAEEFGRVHDAQLSRGAAFDQGSLWRRLMAWTTIFIPLFVGMFRRADALAVAMDARCYGVPGVARTSLDERRVGRGALVALAAGLAASVALCALA